MTAQPAPIVAARLDPAAIAALMNHPLVGKWRDASAAISESLEQSLVQLVEIRASQINGCANCINMHAKEARWNGETEQRVYLLSAWQVAPCYDARERAALAWTEALTRLSHGHALEDAYNGLRRHFSAEEQVKLTLVINMINGWNRLAVGFGLFADEPPERAVA
ncbi:MAG: carboxymuconolactone decarboxylase family protein [Caulobacteraceae bacterium]